MLSVFLSILTCPNTWVSACMTICLNCSGLVSNPLPSYSLNNTNTNVSGFNKWIYISLKTNTEFFGKHDNHAWSVTKHCHKKAKYSSQIKVLKLVFLLLITMVFCTGKERQVRRKARWVSYDYDFAKKPQKGQPTDSGAGWDLPTSSSSLLLPSPAISLGFTIWGEILAYVSVFNPTMEVVTFRLMNDACWACLCCRQSPV